MTSCKVYTLRPIRHYQIIKEDICVWWFETFDMLLQNRKCLLFDVMIITNRKQLVQIIYIF